MKIQTSDLSGAQLDWAVAKSEGREAAKIKANGPVHLFQTVGYCPTAYQPSANWSQGGPIIERENIGVMRYETWVADPDGAFEQYGPTPLIAAMRCYVASKLGDEVEIPADLLSNS